MPRLLSAIAEFALRYSRPIIAACLVGTLVFLWGMSKLVFHHDILAWFPEGTAVQEDTYRIDEQLKGVQSFEIVIDTGVENGLYEPELLNSMESLARALLSMQSAGLASSKTLSVVDVVKEINQALNSGDPAFYRLPQDRKLIAQELFLFENSGTDDLEDYVDSQFSRARLMVKLPWSDATTMESYLRSLQDLAAEHLPQSVDVRITGVSSMYAHIVHVSRMSMMQSYLLAGIVISVLMVLFIGDLKLGLLAMIPNFLPIIVTLGVMGLMGIPLTVFTMFVGSIALGLAVDDTLHFFHGFKRYLQRSGDTEQAIHMTFQSTGRALAVTTAALAMGFFIFGLAAMEAARYFGVLTGLTILLALFGDFVLTPAIFKEVVNKRAVAAGAEVSGGVVK